MSTRFYPRFVKGNPQLRVCLPDWTMTMIKGKKDTPKNVVQFKVDPRMTDWDVKNYLEKIYKVQIASVDSSIMAGELKQTTQGVGLTKNYDFKIVQVRLPIGSGFDWPDLFPSEKKAEIQNEYDRSLQSLTKNKNVDPTVKIPSWFL